MKMLLCIENSNKNNNENFMYIYVHLLWSKKNQFSGKPILRKKSRFSLIFMLFFPGGFENYWEF